MNPITRMMKRYIKTPLKYALPLLFIGSLVLVSISGCTSQIPAPNNQLNTTTSVSAAASATPTHTPSVTPPPSVTPSPSAQPSAQTPTPTTIVWGYVPANIPQNEKVTISFSIVANGQTLNGLPVYVSTDNHDIRNPPLYPTNGIYTATPSSPTVGQHALNAMFLGGSQYAGTSSTAIFNVISSPTPAQVTVSFNGANEISHGAVFELSAIVMQGNTPVTTGTVTFSLAGQTYTATQTDSSGIAGRWTSPQFSPITQLGPYTATASYTGPAGTASTTLQITVT